MYKVFIIEDEYLIRNNLREQITALGSYYPITYVGEAGDGEMALSSIIDLQPDIILTDIQMPFMDGLTFSKEARKLLPWTRLIFISGFDDFDYMKGAIQVQADDYLLKPIKSNELKQAIEKAVTALDLQQKETQPSSDLVFELKKNHFLNGLFKGSLTISETLKLAESFNRSLAGKKMTVLLAANQVSTDFEDYAHLSDYLKFLFRENQQVIFSAVSSRFIKFLIVDPLEENVIETSYQVAQTLVHELEKGQKNNFSVAIGPVAERISELPASFEITQMILETASSLKDQIISYEDLIKEAKLPVDSVFYFDLSLDLSSLSKNEVSKYIEHLTKPQGTPIRTRLYRLFVLTKLLQHVCLKEKKIPQEMVHCTSTSQRLAISADDSLYRSTVYMFISFLTALPSQPSRNKYQPILNHALDFIKENFTDPDMSLTWVAQQVALSPSHFSTIFSQSFNQTFIDYLTEQRIELAKKLLQQSDYRISDIAFEIGYNDPNYFSYLFKKKQGISPKEYRTQLFLENKNK